MAYTIAFFGTKPYDEASFNDKNKEYGFELRYYKGHLNKHNVILTQNVDAVCIFVNDTADAEVLHMMADNGVKLLALRCAGYKCRPESGCRLWYHSGTCTRLLALCRSRIYRSPHAVAEPENPRSARTRDGNFSARTAWFRYVRQNGRHHRYGKDCQETYYDSARLRHERTGGDLYLL